LNSQTFRLRCGYRLLTHRVAATSLGAFPLKGVGAEQEIFAPGPIS